MTQTSTCYALTCGHVAPGAVALCPKCGRKMRSSKQVRVLGGVLVAIGIFLVGLMGTITWHLAPGLLHPGEGDGTRFTGTAEQGRMILNLFWLVIAVGAASIANGAWQLATGRRSLAMVLLSLGLAAVLVVVVYSTTRALG